MVTDKFFDFLRLAEEEVSGKTNGLPLRLGSSDLFELAGIGLWVFDTYGMTTYVNKAIASRLGYSREEMLALPMITFTGQKTLELAQWHMRRRKQGIAESHEVKLMHRDGSDVWVAVSSGPMFDKMEKFLGAICILIDITESKRVQSDMVRDSELLKAITRSAEDIIYIKDRMGRYLMVNEASGRFLGHPPEELIGKTAADFDSPDKVAEIELEDQTILQKGVTLSIECSRSLNGETRSFLMTKSPCRNANGEITGVIGITRDITKLKHSEQSLRESEERYRTILENIQDGYFECDLSGKITFCNDAFCRIHGYSREACHSMDYRDYLTPENARRTYQAFHQVYLTGVPLPSFEIEVITPEGAVHYLDESVSLIRDAEGKAIGFRGIVRDMTERRLAEKATRKSAERFRTMANQAPAMIWITGQDGRCTFVNQQWIEFTGRTLEEELELGWLQCVHPDDMEAGWEAFESASKAGRPYRTEFRARRHDGAYRWILSSGMPRYASNGDCQGYIGSCIDITERKEAEEAQRRSEERYRTILETINDGYFETTLAGQLTFVNDGLVRMFGHQSKDELVGLELNKFTEEPHTARLLALANTTYQSGNPVPSFVYELKRLDGLTCDVDMSLSLITDDAGRPTGFRGIIRDVTARRRSETLIEGQVKILEMIAAGAPLKDTLEALIHLVEKLFKANIGSILLLDEEGKHLRCGAAPGLPEEYVRAIDGVAIGPCVGSCGTAAYIGQTVIVADIAQDSLWEDYRDLALRHGLRACWSVPIFSTARQVLGTFALYPRLVRGPQPEDVKLIETLANLASIAIERSQSEAKLQASEARFRALTEKCGEGISLILPDTTLIYSSPGITRIAGYDPHDVLGAKIETRFHPEDLPRFKALIESLSKNPGSSAELRYRYRPGDRSWRWMEATVTNMLEEPSVQAIVLNYRDITDRKKDEDALRASEERFSKAFSVSPEPMCMVALEDGRFLYVNDAWTESVGMTREKVIGHTSTELGLQRYPMPREQFVEWLRKEKQLHDLEVTTERPDGQIRTQLFSFQLIELDEQEVILTVSKDISERKHAEDALRASEERFAKAFHLSPNPMVILTFPQARFVQVNQAWLRQYGFTTEEVIGFNSVEFGHLASEEFQRLRRSTDADMEVRLFTKSGEQRIAIISTELIELGGVTHILSTSNDITERKRTEDALRASEERFAKAFNASPEPMCLVTLEEGRFLQINDAWEKCFGLKRDDLIGRTTTEINLTQYPMARDQFVEWIKKEGHIRDWELSRELKDGQTHTFLISIELVELNGEQVILSVSKDITERKRMEELLRASEERFAKAFNASPQPMAILELPSRRYTNVNEALVKSSGWTMEEMIGRTAIEIGAWVEPEDPERVADLTANQGAIRNLEMRFRTKSGEIRDFLYSAERIAVDNRPHTLIVANDITERKLAEKALRRNEALLRSIIESNPDWIFVKDLDHRYKLVNQSYADALHMRVEDFVGKNDLELGFPEEQVKGSLEKGIRGFWPADREVFATGQTQVVEEDPAEVDGQTHMFNTIKVPLKSEDGKVWGVLGVARDLTGLRRVESALRSSEERFAKAFNASPQPMVIFEAPGRRIVSVNEAMVRSFGWQAEEMVGKTPADLNFWVDPEQQRHVRALLASHGFVRDLEVKFRTKSGEVREFLYGAETVNLKNTPHVLVVVNDVTERNRVQAALQKSEERYRLLFENGFVGIIRATLDGRILECNDAAARVFGYKSCEELQQFKTPVLYFDNEQRPHLMDKLRQDGNVRNEVRQMKRKDGSPVWTLSNITLLNPVRPVGPVREEEPILEGVLLDITERKLIEEELAQSHEQLRSLSTRVEKVREEERTRIAREIHDNLGQTLTGLKMDFSWIEKKLSRTTDDALRGNTAPKLKEIAKLLEETIQTVRDIATELRPGVLDTLGLCAAIDWQAREFEKRSGIKSKVRVCHEPQGLPVEHATALFRVFQEILTNIARHSRAKRFSVEVAEAGGDLTLSVRDDGIGVTEEQLRHHKSLGLIGMRERVLVFGGTVKIEGLPGQGTTVNVKMPVSRQLGHHYSTSL